MVSSTDEKDDGFRTPVECAIEAFGSGYALARALEIPAQLVSKWKRPPERDGCAGFIPRYQAARLFYIAKERGIPLTAEELLVGRYDEAV